jgi:hypothetical protein
MIEVSSGGDPAPPEAIGLAAVLIVWSALSSQIGLAGRDESEFLRRTRAERRLRPKRFERCPQRFRPVRVTSSKTLTEYMFSELPQITDIVASSNNRYSA